MNSFFKRVACLVSVCVMLASCMDEPDVPLVRTTPAGRATVNLLFVDKANPDANVVIYVNGELVGFVDRTYYGIYDYDLGKWIPNTKGLQSYQLGDSLLNRTLTISLATFDTQYPPDAVDKENIIYETVVLPSELATTSAIIMSRANADASIELTKLNFSDDEPAPSPGHFKIRFYNGLVENITIERRDGSALPEAYSLAPLSKKPFIELPFGLYRFTLRRADGSMIQEIDPPLIHGTAGKCFTLFLTKDQTRGERQVLIENRDYGLPENPYAHLGFLNADPDFDEVTFLPLVKSSRKSSETKFYGEFTESELLPSGQVTIKVKVGSQEITQTYDLPPWSYTMVYLLKRNGQPELYFRGVAMAEYDMRPGEINEVYVGEVDRSKQTQVAYVNASDIERVSFMRLDRNFNGDNLPATIIPLDEQRSLNVAQREVRSVVSEGLYGDYENRSWSVFKTQELDDRRTLYGPIPPLKIQAHYGDETENPTGVGPPIPNTKVQYPFFNQQPTEDIASYSGYRGQPGVFTVVLIGTADANASSEHRPKVVVLHHSF